MDDSKSNMALLNLVVPIVHERVKLSGSLHLGGNFICTITHTYSSRIPTLLPYCWHLVVQSYLRNLAYLCTFFIASNRGMLTCTLRKVSKIPYLYSSSFDL